MRGLVAAVAVVGSLLAGYFMAPWYVMDMFPVADYWLGFVDRYHVEGDTVTIEVGMPATGLIISVGSITGLAIAFLYGVSRGGPQGCHRR